MQGAAAWCSETGNDERCRLFEQYADIRINEDGLSMGETVEKVLAIFGDIRGEGRE